MALVEERDGMRLHPSAIPGYAPMLRIGDLPDSLRELANSCSLNMQQMRIHCREYAASVALKQYADASLNAEWDSYNANKGPSDFSFRPHDTLWPDWSLLGARSAGLALRNYVTALEPMRQNLGRIAMWRDKINFHDLKRVKKDFDTRFPGIDRIRHAIAHPEFFANPDKGMATASNLNVPGVEMTAIHNGGKGSISNAMVGNHFGTSFEGEMYSVDISTEAAQFLVANLQLAFAALGDAAVHHRSID